MKKIISIFLLSLVMIVGLVGCQGTQKTDDQIASNYECLPNNTLNCVGGGAPGSLCKDSEFVDWANENCPGFQILE